MGAEGGPGNHFSPKKTPKRPKPRGPATAGGYSRPPPHDPPGPTFKKNPLKNPDPGVLLGMETLPHKDGSKEKGNLNHLAEVCCLHTFDWWIWRGEPAWHPVMLKHNVQGTGRRGKKRLLDVNRMNYSKRDHSTVLNTEKNVRALNFLS